MIGQSVEDYLRGGRRRAATVVVDPPRTGVSRAAIDASQQLDFAAALSHEAAWQSELGGAHDYLEGVAAFMAKRPPVFTDR